MMDNQIKKKYILNSISDYLKKYNFKKKEFTFKRETEKGLLQIIELRLGPSWTSKSGEINLEFGIYTNEWSYFLNHWKTPATIRTADCELRDCYCTILDKINNHYWFNLSDDLDKLSLKIISVLENSIIPLLDKLKSRNDILTMYHSLGENMGLPPRHRLSIGILNYGIGEYKTALEIITEEFNKNSRNTFYNTVFKSVEEEIKKQI